MGYMRHHAILVTSWSDESIALAHSQAASLLAQAELSPTMLSPILAGSVNAEHTFVVAPDGSKEGWDTSDSGDAFRTAFVAWLRSQEYEGGSSALAWAEVQYGDDEGEAFIVNHSDDDLPAPTQEAE